MSTGMARDYLLLSSHARKQPRHGQISSHGVNLRKAMMDLRLRWAPGPRAFGAAPIKAGDVPEAGLRPTWAIPAAPGTLDTSWLQSANDSRREIERHFADANWLNCILIDVF